MIQRVSAAWIQYQASCFQMYCIACLHIETCISELQSHVSLLVHRIVIDAQIVVRTCAQLVNVSQAHVLWCWQCIVVSEGA